MADQGFPAQHTTTVTTSNTTVQTNIRYDPRYVRTIPGMLKVAQIVSNSFRQDNEQNKTDFCS
jgi:hypothetical protein